MIKKIGIWGIAVVMMAAVLSGCASDSKDIPEDTPEHLYVQGRDAFDQKDYEKAARLFDEVERQHPYSEWAARSQVMMAYAYYQSDNYDDAILALDRFIQLHPGNKNTPYAYYLKGLCYFEEISDVGREQRSSLDAQETFERVIAFFPKSVYVADARAKLALIKDQLAGKEMAVGRYYLKQHDYVAAINRFQTVLTDHANSNQVPEAMYRLTAAYMALGMKDQASVQAKILDEKYPKDVWNGKAKKVIGKK